VLGFLVTEFVRDFGGEDATPIQLGFHRGLLAPQAFGADLRIAIIFGLGQIAG